MLFVSLALLFLALALCAVRQMHFFQLNSYKWAEHKVWLGRNSLSLLILAIIALLALIELFFGSFIFLSAVIAVFALFSVPKSKKRSKACFPRRTDFIIRRNGSPPRRQSYSCAPLARYRSWRILS